MQLITEITEKLPIKKKVSQTKKINRERERERGISMSI